MLLDYTIERSNYFCKRCKIKLAYYTHYNTCILYNNNNSKSSITNVEIDSIPNELYQPVKLSLTLYIKPFN